MRWKERVTLIIAIVIGLSLGWFEARSPHDDEGTIVARILSTTCILGVVTPRRPWMCALAVGICTSVWGFATGGIVGMGTALTSAFTGVYLGAYIRELLSGISGDDAEIALVRESGRSSFHGH